MSLISQSARFLSRGGAAPVQPAIFKMRQSSLPQFGFEWHPGNKIVYVIDVEMGLRTGRATGNAIAFDVDTEGAAYNAMLIWCRGYKAAKDSRSHNDSGKTVLLGLDS